MVVRGPMELGLINSSHTVRSYIHKLVESGRFKVGSKLPTERALAEQLGVQRNAVRDALAVLESEGIVVRKIGSGTFVSALPTRGDAPDAIAKDVSPNEIIAARMVFEPTISRLSVLNATAADIESIETANKAASVSQTIDEFEHWDGLFHQNIANSTRNRLIIEMYSLISKARDATEWGDLKRQSLTDARRSIYVQEHDKIISALRSRNISEMETSSVNHLIRIRDNLLGEMSGPGVWGNQPNYPLF